MISRVARIAVVLNLLGVLLHAQNSIPNDSVWIPNGTVYTMAHTHNTLYLGGRFTQVGPYMGHAVPIDASGKPFSTFSKVNGVIWAVASDGLSGWYIAGGFTQAGSLTRNEIVHIKADGTADPSWNSQSDGSTDIRAIVVQGGTVFVGGSQLSFGGVPRGSLAALDAATGHLLPWSPNADGNVWALALRDSTIYAGGQFTQAGGVARQNIAALNIRTALATSWNPGANGWVHSLAVNDSTVFAGGEFDSVGHAVRSHIAGINRLTGLTTSWNPGANNIVSALVAKDSTLYAVGYFDTLNSLRRQGAGAFNSYTGVLTSWNPTVLDKNNSATAWAMAVDGPTVYIGGAIASVGGVMRNGVAAVDAVTGALLHWNPNANGAVLGIGVNQSGIFIAGEFTGVAGFMRNGIAAIDVSTGRATNWSADVYSPDPQYTGVSSLVQHDSVLYVGGYFTSIGGQTRWCIAAIDTASGSVLPWDPHSNGIVLSMAVDSSVVYAGGKFTTIGGQSRYCLAALDSKSGNATPWNPGPDGGVFALSLADSNLYLGGVFNQIGLSGRSYIGAVNTHTGLVTSWNPNADMPIGFLAVNNRTVYAAGYFQNIGGKARNYLAALSRSTGNATPWVAKGGGINSLYLNGRYVYAGLTALDTATGAVVWDPKAMGSVNSACVIGSTIYGGGDFGFFNGVVERPSFARFDNVMTGVATQQPVQIPTNLALDQNYPNPFNPTTVIEFSIPHLSVAKLQIFDMLGREVATLVNEQKPAGTYSVTWDASTLASGVYFYRLEAGNEVQVKKLILLK